MSSTSQRCASKCLLRNQVISLATTPRAPALIVEMRAAPPNGLLAHSPRPACEPRSLPPRLWGPRRPCRVAPAVPSPPPACAGTIQRNAEGRPSRLPRGKRRWRACCSDRHGLWDHPHAQRTADRSRQDGALRKPAALVADVAHRFNRPAGCPVIGTLGADEVLANDGDRSRRGLFRCSPSAPCRRTRAGGACRRRPRRGTVVTRSLSRSVPRALDTGVD